jgi:tetratricopeptide (TPR) repeat protein
VLANLSTMQMAGRDLDGAAASLEEALALQQRRLGDEHPALAATLGKLAQLQHARKHDEEARKLWEQSLRIRRAAQASPRELAEALYACGVFHADVGEHEQAVALFREAVELHHAQDLGDPLGLGRVESVLGTSLARLGRRDEARLHLDEAARLFDAHPGASEEERARVRKSLEAIDRAPGR